MSTRSYLICLSVLFGSLGLQAQQEPLFTQFMYNKLQFNPGYAGAVDGVTFTGLYRNQWMGLNGAPTQEQVSANIPLAEQKYGLGLLISHRSIGISDQVHIDGSYAYRIPLGQGFASAGVQASARYYGSNYNDPELNPNQGQDPELGVGAVNRWVPNVGFGLYYYTSRFYGGISLPRLIDNKLEKDEEGLLISKEVVHTYVTGGYSFDVSPGLSITPQLMGRFARNAPPSFDFNVMVGIADIYFGGVTYRSAQSGTGIGESIDALFGVRFTPRWFFGLSYDIGLNAIRRANNGSLEASLRYTLTAPDNTDFSNPRYF